MKFSTSHQFNASKMALGTPPVMSVMSFVSTPAQPWRRQRSLLNRHAPAICQLGTPPSSASVKLMKEAANRVFSRIADLRKSISRKAGPRPRKTTDAEWEELMDEFEERVNPDRVQEPRSQLAGGKIPRYLNPEQFEMLPYIECSFMAAMTIVMWMLGRHLRLDSFLLLFYPLPNMYIAARWGLSLSDSTLWTIIFVMFVSMGPMYAFQYMFNSGLLTYTYARALWYGWSWPVSLLAGSLAKAIGICCTLVSASFMLRNNAWALITDQVTGMLTGMLVLANKLPFIAIAGKPTERAVAIALATVVSLHSIYHVLCTLFICALVLIRVSERAHLARVPKEMPFIYRLLRRTRNLENP